MEAVLDRCRFKTEGMMGACNWKDLQKRGWTRSARGVGRFGADFWKVIKDGRGRLRARLAGRYPESYWGQLNMSYCVPALFSKGTKEPLRTLRSECFREGIQDLEATVFLEKAIMLPKYGATLGADWSGRCRKFLDDRRRLVFAASGVRKKPNRLDPAWPESRARLYSLAAEAAAKLGVSFIAEGRAESREAFERRQK
jgi:hypothetical protein